ncbi:MAG: outer membrane lipoprotein-sorting protein [Gammaproteobacteria bacterium]|nr:outer membrane lipoprotein-sorting protein [Gammaproteobacteria bacterium]MBU1777667.1 outer membrane lipoprotein-sorting protein [Gammaproteobacteria bacterium]MBU1968336.1 outer membrane lipoprotein-sorting protein [Gammaproteobacteria bacterium]
MTILFRALLLLFAANAYAAPDAHSILKDSDQARGGGLPGIVWEIRLQSRDGERNDEPQRILVKAVDDSSVAETQEPVRFKGSKILQVERNMWMTRPGLSKPIPISPRQRMSGQASNGDIAATNYAGDYDAELAGTENVDGEECHVLNLAAKHKRATYDKIRYWVSVKRVVGIKAEFYSVSGKLLKTASFQYGNTIEHDGRRIPFISRMTIRDALIDAETVMEFGTVKVKKIAASEFDLGQMQ